MPSIFGGIKFETPTEAQARLRSQQQEQFNSLGNTRQQGGFLLGQALQAGIRKLRGKTAEPVQRARNSQEVIAQTERELNTALEQGADPLRAQFDAMMKAASRFSSMGRTEEASQLTSQAVALAHQIEERDLERSKLLADQQALDEQRLQRKQTLEDSLRKEVDSQLEDTTVVVDQLGATERNARLDSPAGDLAMIFSFMKVLDPNSVVRESEFSTVADAREGLAAVASGQSVEGLDVSQEAAARIVSMLRGTRFTDITRAQIVNAARAAAQDRVRGSKSIIEDAMELATDRDLDLEAVRSGLAERVQGVNVQQLTPAQLSAVASGVMSLTDVLDGKERSDSDVRRDARAILGIE